MLKISSRPALPDRIQLVITPKILDLLHGDENNKRSMKNDINKKLSEILINNGKEKGFEKKPYFKDDNRNAHYTFKIDSEYDYISKIHIDCYAPFHIALTLNFNRYLRSILLSDPEKYNFDIEYDKKIKLDADNYINKEIWKGWNDALIGQLLHDLKSHILRISDKIMYDIYSLFEHKYENVTVKQIEMCKDYFVGNNQSLTISELLNKHIHTAYGQRFINDIESTSYYHRVPKIKIDDGFSCKHKNECSSIQFQIGNNLFYKIYRKDKDHIRCEITAKNKFIKNRFKTKYEYGFDKNLKYTNNSSDIYKILPSMKKLSKDIFKGSNFENFVSKMYDQNKRLLDTHKINIVNDFLEKSKQYELQHIIDCVANDVQITNAAAISYLKRHRDVRLNFYRSYNGNGRSSYIYDPVKAMNQRNEMIQKRLAKPNVINVIDEHKIKKIYQRKQNNLVKSLNDQKRKFARTMDEVEKYKLPNQYDFFSNELKIKGLQDEMHKLWKNNDS